MSEKSSIPRRKTRLVKVGNVKIGAGCPIVIQSMAKSETTNIKKTIDEIKELTAAGCEIVRVAVKNEEAADAIKKIKSKISIPLIADIHFSPHLARCAIKNGADKIRLNPGNINKRGDLENIIKAAKKRKIPIRIGVNSGSVDRALLKKKGEIGGLVESIKKYLEIFEANNFYDIILSAKSSDVFTTIEAYRAIQRLGDYPLHLGITASGPYEEGIVKSAIGIGALLNEGIGDTIRVSLTAPSVAEVYAAKNILKALKLRAFGPEIISCPTCGRCEVNLIKIVTALNKKIKENIRFQSKNCTVAVMGCVVNGPGEAKDADFGIAAGRGCGVLFKKGKKIATVKESQFVDALLKELKGL